MTPIELAAASLLEARRGNAPVPAADLPDAASAYAAQAAVAEAMNWFADAPPKYWKSGGPSRTALATHAALPPAGVFSSPADLGTWPFRLRGVEAEIALRLGEPVDAARAAGLDLESARSLVDAMCVSIELVDSRWAEGPEAPAWARLADLQSHGALVLGSWVPFGAFAAHDWAAQRCSVRIGSGEALGFTGSHSMGDPAFVLMAWLRHATQGGAIVEAGTVVTTGTWCGLLHAQPGDAVRVAFEGIGETSVRL
jgi:2-keto-4-pentenoate hydratase